MTPTKSYIDSSDVVGMALMGGYGDRLAPLTLKRTKPAVTFGHTILGAISTSSLENSGIDKIVIISYRTPRRLEHFYQRAYGTRVGIDADIEITNPLHQGLQEYKGTADAVRQTLNLAKSRGKKYVAIVSGDHVYKLDFREVFKHHAETSADFTIPALEVPGSEAKRFGVLHTENGGSRVTGFHEKPQDFDKEKAFASMGIYVCSIEFLEEALKIQSDKFHDFGKDIIPTLIELGKNVQAYRFTRKWWDVGTPHALFDANMAAFIDRTIKIADDHNWPIKATLQPQFHDDGMKYFSAGYTDIRGGHLDRVVVTGGITLSKSKIRNSVLFGGISRPTSIENAVLENAILDKNVGIRGGALRTTDGNLVMITEGVQIADDTVVDEDRDVVVVTEEQFRAHERKLREFESKLKENGRPVRFLNERGRYLDDMVV